MPMETPTISPVSTQPKIRRTAQVLPVEQELADDAAEQAADGRRRPRRPGRAAARCRELPQREDPQGVHHAQGQGDQHAQEHALEAVLPSESSPAISRPRPQPAAAAQPPHRAHQ